MRVAAAAAAIAATAGLFLARPVQADVVEKATKISFRDKMSLPGGSASLSLIHI